MTDDHVTNDARPGPEPMDHAAAHERIEDLLLEPSRLSALPSSDDPADIALREHLAGCPACGADLEGWRRLQLALGAAIPTDPNEAAEATSPVHLPPSLGARVLARIRDEGASAAPIPLSAPPRRRRVGSWVGLAAGIGIVAGTGAFAFQQVAERAAAEASARDLAAALEIVDRMLATDHKVVQLETAEGAPAGTISWSRHDWVVLTTALDEPPAGRQYLCWLETDGRSVPIGHMYFAGRTAYWVATLDEWQTWEIEPTTRFLVTLEAVGAQHRTGLPVLEASLAT